MASTRQVILIGTAHRYQLSGQPGADELKVFAKMCARKFGIRAIGEEMSPEGLKEGNVSSSVCAELALSLKIGHRYCDPESPERKRLKIPREIPKELIGWLPHSSAEEDARKNESARRRREQYWISELIDLDLWPALFLCGAYHVDTVRDLLTKYGIAVEVAHQDWSPEDEF